MGPLEGTDVMVCDSEDEETSVDEIPPAGSMQGTQDGSKGRSFSLVPRFSAYALPSSTLHL